MLIYIVTSIHDGFNDFDIPRDVNTVQAANTGYHRFRMFEIFHPPPLGGGRPPLFIETQHPFLLVFLLDDATLLYKHAVIAFVSSIVNIILFPYTQYSVKHKNTTHPT